MKARKFLASLVAVFVLALVLSQSVSAETFANITSIYVDGVNYDFTSGQDIGIEAGAVVPIQVVFTANMDARDVRVTARIRGSAGVDDSSELFAIIAGNEYRKTLYVELPRDIDPSERVIVQVELEKQDGQLGTWQKVYFEVQRKSYNLEILSVDSVSDEVSAGDVFALDVVLKNIGFEPTKDNYIEAFIPELGARSRVYFGDLSEIDQPIRQGSSDRLNKEDTAQGRIYLKIPSNAAAGVYDVELTAYNNDAETTTVKRIVVTSGVKSSVFSTLDTKKFGVNEMGEYTMTIVNAGNSIQIYTLVIDADAGLNVNLDETMVAVPAGSSKIVKLTANAGKEGTYNFAVNVHSDGELVQQEGFIAKVEGSSAISSGNAAVVLTIILAIIFIVLLVVLIVLLTRKPVTKEEFGESYY